MKHHFLSLTFLLALPLNCESFEFSLQSGFHREYYHLKNTKDDARECLRDLNWQVMSPEVRLSIFFKTFLPVCFEADVGILSKSPSGNTFHGHYKEDELSDTFINKTQKQCHLSGIDYCVGVSFILPVNPALMLLPIVGHCETQREFTIDPGKFSAHKNASTETQSVEVRNVHYKTNWFGPWLGLRVAYTFSEDFKIVADVTYHEYRFNGRSHWKINDKLVDGFCFHSKLSTVQKGFASGFKCNATLIHQFCDEWKIFLHGYYYKLYSRKTTDSTQNYQVVIDEKGRVISDGEIFGTPKYRFDWHAWSLLGGVTYVF